MKLWDVSGDARLWTVELDVRDLGDHLDFTRRAGVGTLSRRVKEATHDVAARGEYLPAGSHAVEPCLLPLYLSSCYCEFGLVPVRSPC